MDRLPDPIRRHRHVEVIDTGCPQCVDDGVHARRHGAGRAGFADAFRAQQVGRRRRGVVQQIDRRQEMRARHRVVHEAAGQHLPVLRIVQAAFPEHMACALNDAADDLPIGESRIENGADIVDGGIAHDARRTGRLVDLDLDHMSGGWKSARYGILRERIQRMLLIRLMLLDQFKQRNGAIGSGDAELALVEFHVVRVRFQRGRGEQSCLLDHGVRCDLEGAPLQHARARADRRIALQARAERIGGAQLHRAARQAEPVLDHVRKDRFVALAAWTGDAIQNDRSATVEFNRNLIDADTAAAGRLEERRAAATQEFPTAGGLRLAAAEACPVRGRFRLLQQRREVAAVQHRTGPRRVRDLLRCDRVAQPQRQRIAAEACGGFVHQPLDDINGFRPAGAAIGIGRRGVGHHLAVAAIDGVDVIDAGADGLAVDAVGEHAGGCEICAGVAQPFGAQAGEASVSVIGQLSAHRDRAAMIVGEEILRPCGEPFDRALEHAGGVHQQRIFRKRAGPCAERAADIDPVHAQQVGRHVGQRRQFIAKGKAALAGAVDIETTRRRVVADKGAARFHRRRGDARALQRHLDDAGGTRECGGGVRVVAVFEIEADIAGNVLMQAWRIGRERGVKADHRRQVAILDLDQIGGVARGIGGCRDHQRHFLADKARTIARHHRPLGNFDGLSVPTRWRNQRHGFAERDVFQILSGEDGQDVWAGARRGGVDRNDGGVRPVRPAEERMDLIVTVPVAGVAPLAGDKTLILAAACEAVA